MSNKDQVLQLLKRIERYQPTRGEIYAIDGDVADVKPIGGMGLLRHLEIYGDPSNLSVGDNILMTWVDRPGTPGKVPIILAQAAASSYSGAIDGSGIALGSITPEHLSFEIEGGGDIFYEAGWRVTSDGAIYNWDTVIHPSGQIALGRSPDIIKLDSQHATYRLWAGNVDPTAATFSVSATGEIFATAGEIAGWELSTNAFTSDSGNAGIYSGTNPYIQLGGATGYMAGPAGFWVGKDTDTTYKMHLGDPAGDHMRWDGNELYITGTFVGDANIERTEADTFTINYDLDNVDVQLIFAHPTASGTLTWDGAELVFDNLFNVDQLKVSYDIDDYVLLTAGHTEFSFIGYGIPYVKFSVSTGQYYFFVHSSNNTTNLYLTSGAGYSNYIHFRDGPTTTKFQIYNTGNYFRVHDTVNNFSFLNYNSAGDFYIQSQNIIYLQDPTSVAGDFTVTTTTSPTFKLAYDWNSYITMDVDAGGNLAIEAADGDNITIGTPLTIGSDDWASGMTGWRVRYDGSADFRAITADSLQVETFIADVNLALAGSQLITPSLSTISRDFPVPETTGTLYVYDLPGTGGAAVFANGDWVKLRYISRTSGLTVDDAWGTVVAVTIGDEAADEQAYTWTKQSGTTGWVIYAGMIALDYGTSGDGYIHSTVLDGAPYIEVASWTTDPSVPANNASHVKLSASAYVAVGAVAPTGYLSHDGFWVGDDSGTYKMHLGDVDAEHLRWDGSTIQILSDSSNYLQFSGNDLSFVSAGNTTLLLDGATGDATFGRTSAGQSNLFFDTSAGTLNLRTGTTTYVQLQTGGDVRFGLSTGGNLFYDASASTLYIRHSSTNVMTFPSSGNASIIGTLDVSSPGKITAGGGDTIIDADGIEMIAPTNSYWTQSAALKWTVSSGGNVYGYLSGYSDATLDEATVDMVCDASVYGASYKGEIFLDVTSGSTGDDSVIALIARHDANSTGRTAQIALKKGSSDSVAYIDADYVYFGANNANTSTIIYNQLLVPEVRLTDTTCKLTQVSDMVRVQGAGGYVEIGCSDTTYGRIQTDRGRFYMNKHVSMAQGLHVGNSTLPTDNDITYDGNLRSAKNSTAYDVYACHWYTVPKTNTSWSGDDAKTAGTYTIDTSTWGVPAAVKAVYIRLEGRWTAQYDSYWMAAKPSGGTTYALAMRPNGANIQSSQSGWVPCNSSGDIQVVVSGVGTCSNVLLEIWGYSI